MARLVVRNRDKVNPDSPYMDCACMKRGMVVDILPDGASLGVEGDRYDGWTVIEVPGAASDALSAFLSPEPGDGKVNRMLQRRAFKLDLDALQTTQPTTMMVLNAVASPESLSLEQALSLKVPTSPLVDPNILI